MVSSHFQIFSIFSKVYNSVNFGPGSFSRQYGSGQTLAIVYSSGFVLHIPPVNIKVNNISLTFINSNIVRPCAPRTPRTLAASLRLVPGPMTVTTSTQWASTTRPTWAWIHSPPAPPTSSPARRGMPDRTGRNWNVFTQILRRRRLLIFFFFSSFYPCCEEPYPNMSYNFTVSPALHWHCTVLQCRPLYCKVLHCTALQCTSLHFTALHCSTEIVLRGHLYCFSGVRKCE